MFVESVNLVYDCVAAMQVLLGHVSQMGHKIARAGTAGTIKLLLRESRVQSVSTVDPYQMNLALRHII